MLKISYPVMKMIKRLYKKLANILLNKRMETKQTTPEMDDILAGINKDLEELYKSEIGDPSLFLDKMMNAKHDKREEERIYTE